jgi:transposase
VGQLGFYDLDKRLKALSAKGDPLEALNALVPFESFRAEIEAVVRLAPEARKSNAGRKPFDAVLMFKVLVLQTLYNLADEQVEYQVRDRLSFMRFLGLGLEDVVPDATTLWLFREALGKANLVKALFERFNGYLNAKGYIARGGQIPDQVRDRCHHCQRTQAAQQPRGERGDQGRQDARGLGGQAGQGCAEGQGCALDQEERQELLRLQEPHQHRPQAQADPPLGRDRRLRA